MLNQNQIYKKLRPDLQTITQWITPGSRVLDLGCGNGALLAYLKQEKQVNGYGLEIDAENIRKCIAANVNVIEQNLNHGLNNFCNDSFDIVIMSQTLQAIRHPNTLLNEMIRISKEIIVTLPNFGHWYCRLYLLTKGKMPISSALPYNWYDTPNIHLCTFKDFEELCFATKLKILHRTIVDYRHQTNTLMRYFPNLFGEVIIYHLAKNHEVS